MSAVPELPEVEAYRGRAMAAVGRPVAEVSVPDPWYVKQGATPATLVAVLSGSRLVGARRIGKLLLVGTERGPVVGIRFGMTGTLVVDGDSGVGPLLYGPRRDDPNWDRLALRFEDGGSLVVRDPRRLGGITVDPDTSHLGPDALSITRRQLGAALAGSTVALKARLLDQARIAGIGNLIADELLWRAGVSPLRPAASLSGDELDRVHGERGRTLADLMARGGSHRGDLMGERHPGGRCPKDGAELTKSVVGGRATWWCAVHQG